MATACAGVTPEARRLHTPILTPTNEDERLQTTQETPTAGRTQPPSRRATARTRHCALPPRSGPSAAYLYARAEKRLVCNMFSETCLPLACSRGSIAEL